MIRRSRWAPPWRQPPRPTAACSRLVPSSSATRTARSSACWAAAAARKSYGRAKFTEIGTIPVCSHCAILSSLRSTKELVANALRSIRRRQSCKVPGSTPCTGAMVIGSVKQLPARRWGVRAGKPRRHTNERSVGKTPRSFPYLPSTDTCRAGGRQSPLNNYGASRLRWVSADARPKLRAARSRRPLRQGQSDVQLAQLLGRHLGGGAHQQVVGLLVHGEQGHLAQVLGADQQHHHAVDAGRHAAVRRGAVLERSIHPAEALLHHLRPEPGDAERLDHGCGLVIADASARDLEAVADDVVLVGLDGQQLLIRFRSQI